MSSIDGKNGKQYWRSLDQLADSPEFRQFTEREFPEGASEMTDPVTRRTFLKLMGASAALAGLTGCRRPVEKIIPYVVQPEEVIPGIPNYYATAMPFGTGAYGLVVENHEGRPTKIEGNPKHPSSLGGSNAFMQAQILGLYDPDRSQRVLHKGVSKKWSDFTAAWRELYPKFVENQGKGLAILSESFASPTMARLKAEFEAMFPQAVWATYEPVTDETLFEGIEIATGQAYQPRYHFDKADVVLSVDADFTLMESENVVNARGFIAGRRLKTEHDPMNRLYMVESMYTATGAVADHRLRLQSSQIGAFVAALAQELQAQGVPVSLDAIPVDGTAHFDKKWLEALAKDLAHAPGKCLIVAGRRQSPAVHAMVFALNTALGNIGQTVDYYPFQDVERPRLSSFTDLLAKIGNQDVNTLVMLGGNPVYDAPADMDMTRALKSLQHSIHLSSHVNETSKLAEWHLPQTHFLEAWGDVRAVDGTLSVVQPMIAPLFGAKSAIEVLSLLITGKDGRGYDLVRATWLPRLGELDFEQHWRKVLHEGVLENSAATPVVPGLNSESIRAYLQDHPIVVKSGMEIVFYASPATFDGRFANNGWLQELPDSMTKLTWDNAALMSATTAKELGVENENWVELSYRGKRLKMPVWVMPGMADKSVAVALGYGREAAGRVGDRVGFNTYRLRTSQALHFDQGLSVTKLPGTYEMACTQDHHGMDTEKLAADQIQKRLPMLIREMTLSDYQHHPDQIKRIKEHDRQIAKSLWKEPSYDEGYQWGMVIDLNACVGCNACTIACQSENNIPVVGKTEVRRGREMHWIRIDRYFTGNPEKPDDAEMVYQPVACHHCENAPCEQVCPFAATMHDKEGLNVMVYNRCVGTRYCLDNCPYKVRRFNFFNYTKATPEIVKMGMNPDVTVRFRGVMEKCTYCTQRINYTRIKVKNEFRNGTRPDQHIHDGEVVSACQQACPTQAITFGNINDPQSQVTQMKAINRDYEMLAELNIKPRTSYLAKVRNPNPELEPVAVPPTTDDDHSGGSHH
ncbi:MAG: 4Fe-4S dicluster domain-containing protein [Gemmatimonadetes bacterium]|nr:MAG: 4Fe-4S dicluster domain-containing protein [Gemmatimonadota bacterium]